MSSERVRVSVIIPCYKDSATLGAALDSIYAQTRTVDEVIVVNDASPETEAIEVVLERFPAITYIKNDVNLGLAASRNVGLYAATCDVISFLDADDQLHPQKIELQLGALGAGIALSCGVKRFSLDIECATPSFFNSGSLVQEHLDSRAILLRNRLTGASIMISRELLLQFGGYDGTLKSCEDYDLWLRLLEGGVVIRNIPLPLYFYRLNESGLSRNALNISFWETQVLRKHLSRPGEQFLETWSDASIWAVWLLRHLWRYEICKNPELRNATRKNITLLSCHPILMTLVRIIDKCHLMRLILIDGFKAAKKT